MITPLQSWIAIVALIAAAIALRLTRYLITRNQSRRAISMSNERELLYLPGDPLKANTEDYDDTEDF